jgi:hypothetical protein
LCVVPGVATAEVVVAPAGNYDLAALSFYAAVVVGDGRAACCVSDGGSVPVRGRACGRYGARGTCDGAACR